MAINTNNWKRSHTFNGGYSSYLDGKWHKYQGLDGCLDEIRDLVEDAYAYAEQVTKENEDLRDLHWENEKLKEMKAELDEAREERYCGFPMTKQQRQACRDWEDQHWTNQHAAPDTKSRLAKMGAIGGSFYYKFVPTSIGTSGCIVCSSCMEKARRNCGDNRDRLRELIKEYDAEFQFQEIG